MRVHFNCNLLYINSIIMLHCSTQTSCCDLIVHVYCKYIFSLDGFDVDRADVVILWDVTLTSHAGGRNMMLRVHVVCCLLLPGRLEVRLERRGGGGGRHIGAGDISQHLKERRPPQKKKMSSWSPPSPAFVIARKALLTARDLSSTYVFVSSCRFALCSRLSWSFSLQVTS